MAHTVLTQEEFDQALREGRFYEESEGVIVRNTEIQSKDIPILDLGLIPTSLDNNVIFEDFQGKKLRITGTTQKRNSTQWNVWFSRCIGTNVICTDCSLGDIYVENSALERLYISQSELHALDIFHSNVKKIDIELSHRVESLGFYFSQLSTSVFSVHADDDEDNPHEMHIFLSRSENSENDDDPDFLVRIDKYLDTNLPQVAQGFRLMYPNCEIRYTGDMRHLIR